VNGAGLKGADGKTVSLVGGPVTVTGRVGVASVSVTAGTINVASLASAGNVAASAGGVTVSEGTSLGAIQLENGAELNAGGPGGGSVFIRGGSFVMEGGSYVYASTKGPLMASPTGVPGRGVEVDVTGEVRLDNGSIIGTNVSAGVPDDSGGIRISADALRVRNQAGLQSVVCSSVDCSGETLGDSGDIRVRVKVECHRRERWLR
jgi:hypothetical protein